MKEALKKLQTYNWGDDRNALNPIDDAIVASHGDDAARKEIETALIGVLSSDATRNGKDYACRKLKIIGTDAAVPALASMLGEDNHSHMARFALQSIPGEAASNALAGAISDSSIPDELKVGVIGSLGARGDETAVGPLGKVLSGGNEPLATAAANALGAIRTSDAAKVLASAKPNDAVMNATLCCAEGMLDSGDKAGAKAIYQKLMTSKIKQVKLAATRGVLACSK
jgi:HEAT repeat protein